MYLWCTQSMFFGVSPNILAKSVYRSYFDVSRINPQFSSYICLLGWCVLSHCVCQYLPNENSASVWLDWALWRHCLSGEFSRCLPLSISRCLLSNLSRELLWCFPWSTHNLSSSICLLGWCVLSELVLNCVCQYLPDEDPADCLSGLSSVGSLSLWWAQSVSSAKYLPMSSLKSV